MFLAMATAVERPMSALSDIYIGPERQRRPSVVEVIDVDLLDDPQPNARPIPRPISRPIPRSRQATETDTVISLVDSEDELEITPPVASGSGGSRQGSSLVLKLNKDDNRHIQIIAGSRQRLFSPPPPMQMPHNLPPVPRVPRRFSAFVSPPMRRHPPTFAAPPVVPIAQPFSFEADIVQPPASPVAGPSGMRNHPNRNRRIPVSLPLQAAAPSHHQPTLGLGGAIISLNRARADARAQQRRDSGRQRMNDVGYAQGGVINRTRALIGRVFGAGMGFDDFDDPDTEDGNSDDDAPALHALLAGDERFGHPARAYAYQELMLQRYRDQNRTQNIQYKPEYTHPGKPESGFTFDFAPPSPTEETEKPKAKPAPVFIDLVEMDTDDPVADPNTILESPSSVSSGPPTLQTLLVCARCLEPLVLGGGLVGEEARRRKVWALRCGHMIDGKCLDVVGVPSDEATEELQEPLPGDALVDFKGKGKAKAVEEPMPTPPAENSMRSRLRSRTHIPDSSLPSPALASSSRSNPTPEPSSPVKLGKRKRGKASAKPQIESTHEWTCPVAGCGKVHASVKIGGIWAPEPLASANSNGKGKRRARWDAGGPVYELDNNKSTGGRGAIAVFV